MRNRLFEIAMPFIAAVFSVFLIAGTSSSPRSISMESRPHLLPPSTLKYFTFGYSELVADTIWLRTIQDFDYCENKIERVRARNEAPDWRCDHGWVFHMIDTVTELAPRFRDAYLSGGLFLSILVNDISGATTVFDKGVARFPSDGKINYYAGYHALIEEKNEKKAAGLFEAAVRNGAPAWVAGLAANIYKKEGKLEISKQIIIETLDRSPDPAVADHLKNKLKEIENSIDDPSKTQ